MVPSMVPFQKGAVTMANRSVNLTKRGADGNFHPVEYTATGRIKQDGASGIFYLDWRQGSKRIRGASFSSAVGQPYRTAATQVSHQG